MTASNRLIIIAAASALAAPATAFAQDWTGFYAGVHASRAEFETSTALDITGPLTTFMPLGVEDAERLTPSDQGDRSETLGGHLGYLVQRGDWVIGAEIEASEGEHFPFREQEAFLGRDSTLLRYRGPDLESDWAGSVRLRGGWLARPDLMIYGVGGYAARDLEVFNATTISMLPSYNFGSFISRSKGTVLGWVLGAGAEWKAFDRWGLRAEYTHTDYGDLSVSDPITGLFGLTPVLQGDGRYNTSLVQDEVRLGVSYHF